MGGGLIETTLQRNIAMTKCTTCGKAIGSNGRCKQCLQHRLNEDAKGVDRDRARRTAGAAEDWLGGKGRSSPAKLFNAVKLFASLIKEYMQGTYTEIPWPTIASLVAAVIYVVSPIDAIPDFIPLIGYIDDGVVVALVVAALRNDLKDYCLHRGWSPDDYGLA
jgi:uncharacterized membrane protein YkvA (DUF1232 family)